MKKERPKSKPRLFKQEKTYTCAIACLRMVLDSFDFAIDEPSLLELCQTDIDGTSADDLVRASNELGFQARKEYSNIFDIILDPWRGHRNIPLQQFKIAWGRTRNLAILINKR